MQISVLKPLGFRKCSNSSERQDDALMTHEGLEGLGRASCPASTILLSKVVLMLVQRRRRWTKIKTILDKRHLFAGLPLNVDLVMV